MRGTGDLKWLMWTTIVFVLVFEVGLNYISAFILGFGLYGIWGVQTLDETLRTTLNYVRFRRGKWRFTDA
jgi:Na+-driven multidrug efflux pump